MNINELMKKESRARLLRWTGWFLFANSILLLLISTRYLTLMEWPQALPAQIFILLSVPGHFISLAMVPVLVLSLLLVLIPRRGPLFLLAILLCSLIIFTIVVDTFVFQLFRFHLNGMVWSLITNGGIEEILPLSWVTWLVGILVILFVIGLEIGLALAVNRWIETPVRHGKKIALVSLVMMLSAQGLHAWGDANNYTEITKQVRYLPAYKPFTMKRMLRKYGWANPDGRPEFQVPKSKSGLQYPLEPMQCNEQDSYPNVLILAIDSWRFDMLTREATPAIYEFSENAIRFEKHMSSGNATRFGVFGLFYGLHGTYWHSMLAEEKAPVLIDEMIKRNYQFGVYASARLTNPEFDRTIFSPLRGKIEMRTDGATVVERDRNITDKFLGFLKQRDKQRPFMGFVFYDSPHGYQYPEDLDVPFSPVLKTINHMELNNDFDPVPYRNKFMNAVYYNDTLVADILAELKAQNLLENTIVMITGDHGEEFNETGGNYWGHNSNFARYQVQVPFVLHWPGKPAAVVHDMTSHEDVAPTLLKEMMQCQNDVEQFSNGQDMFALTPRDYLVSSSWDRFGVISENRIDQIFNNGLSESYDLNFKETDGQSLSPKVMAKVMNDMSRFYAK